MIEGDTVKIRPRPYNRNPIVLLLVDRKSRYRWVFNLPNKSGPIVANAIKGFFRGLRNRFGRYPTKFHFDGGTKITDLLTTWLAKRGIKFSTSAPYIHKQNSLVERSVRVILDRVKCTILSSALPQYLWCFILEAIVELVNSTAITNKETTPFQALFNKLEPGIPHIPNLERYRAIGARGEAIIPLEKQSKSLKFTSRTEECKLLAVLGSKTYLVYIPSRRAVLKTSTIKFIEDNTVLSQPTDNTALKGELVDLDLDLEGAVSPDPSNLNTKKPISIEIGPSKLEPYESSSDSKLDKPSPDKPINPVIVESTRPTISIRKPELPEVFPQTIEPIFAPKPIEVIAPNQPITNEPLDNSDLISEGDKMQLNYYKLLAKTSSYILSFVYKARKRVISKDSTPTTYKQVLKLPRDERSKWLEAITKEFIQLLELGVFKFLPRSLLPSSRKLITCRNVLKVKKDAKNRPIKYKSRLVTRGFMQVEGLDYTITYASTSIPPTWRILLAIGAVLDWEIEQADFIGAFLNSALREEIYMEIPEGLLDLAASNKAIYKLLLKYGYNPSTPNIIKLSKALYSLKQSPREWQDKLKILLKSLGYLPLISDPGVFYNAKTCHFIVTYIDNCLFIGPNIGYITDLKKQLNKVYAIEDLGPAAYFLGVQIIRDRPNRRLWLNQVDISFTVQWLSRSLNRPTKSHLNAAKNLFKYLNSTKDYSICFSYNGKKVADLGPKLSNSSNTTTKLSRDFHSKEGPRPLTTTSTTIVDSRNSKGSSRTSIINSSLVPIGFSDSDFTGDKATSKSTYGYLYKLAEAIREVQWIIGLFSKLHRPIDYPITLYRDNQGSITVANDPALHARTKHTLLKFRYVREQVKAKIVTIIYLNTKYDCLFIGPDTGYITDLKKQLNKVYTIEDLGPAAYFLGWLSRSLNRPTKSHLNAAKNLFKYLNSTKDYSICFSCNGNTVSNLGPKLSNGSNITTKPSRDFYFKEGPRPLTTTSTTIVDSRNGKGSSRTSIINRSLVPIGFSDSNFTGDKATSKSTYGYLYKLAGGPISWKTKRATTIALSTLEAETNGLIEAICEVQWIVGLFSELYRLIDHPITLYIDNQGSITVANDPALYARTKYTLLKFRYVRE
ncbi:hypothetical protein P8C59_000964 [Phyllachora maydis]|uniref:Integrase catalytic domain-containing protein n=1 Tax=Phyllachora maydis TaxID=1825666 RepID=A0AAD9HYI2_9PEZI|nr:hypothetical protein P8C59_000964 [Phyllachora maydis]